MRRGRAFAVAATVLTLVVLLIVTALAGMRSPSRTAALAEVLATEPAVQLLVVDALVDELLDGAEQRLGPTAGLLLPLLRAPIEQLVTSAVASPAGRAALTSALSDTLQQLTVRGPTVIDLQAAVASPLADAPPPLAEALRSLTSGGELGRIVLGGGPEGAVDVAPGTVGGVPSSVALAVLLVIALALHVAIGLRAGGLSLLAVGLPTAVLLWLAPEVATGLLDPGTGDDGLLTELSPLLAEGIRTLLGPVRWLATAMAGIGVVLFGVSQAPSTVLFDGHGESHVHDEDRGGHGQDPS